MTILELLEAVSTNGLPLVISTLAIWFVIYNYFQQGKREAIAKQEQCDRDNKYNESLQMLAKSINNQTNSIENQTRLLELLQSSLNKNEHLIREHDEKMTQIFSRHDDRAIAIREDLVELKARKKK